MKNTSSSADIMIDGVRYEINNILQDSDINVRKLLLTHEYL